LFGEVTDDMSLKESIATGTDPGVKTADQPTRITRKKKRLAVDQHMVARSLLDEIPERQPRRGEVVPRPDRLPTCVQQKSKNELYCEVCSVPCSSFCTMKQHQAGQTHRNNVFVRALKPKRLFISHLIIVTVASYFYEIHLM